MELGQKLKQARIEAGLSQRQLCGDVITRNMLSQIENGSARPSMDTLRYLSGILQKPISFFLEENAVSSPNQSCLENARLALNAGNYRQVLGHLTQWRGEDPVFDPERYYLEALAALRQAEAALEDRRPGYAAALLEQAQIAGGKTPYYTPELERHRLILCYLAHPKKAPQLAEQLPPEDGLPTLLAEAALLAGDAQRAAGILDTLPLSTPRWHLLRGESAAALGNYRKALQHYRQAEEAFPRRAAAAMEICCRELEDYKGAYYYACRLRLLPEDPA